VCSSDLALLVAIATTLAGRSQSICSVFGNNAECLWKEATFAIRLPTEFWVAV